MIKDEYFEISRELLTSLVDGLPYMLLLAREDETILLANNSFCETMGLSHKDIVGHEIKACDITILKMISSLNDKGNVKEGECEFVDAQGRGRIFFCSYSPVLAKNGSVCYYIFTGMDITLWKNKELHAEKDESRLRSILQNINEYIYSVEYKDGVPGKTYHSARCFDVTGYTPGELERDPKLWFSMIYPDDTQRVTYFLKNIGTSHQSSYIEHRIVHKRGWVRWVANSYALHRGIDGTILRMDGFIQDITSRRETLDQLRKLSLAVEQSPSSVVITDRMGNIEYVNPKFTELTGYTFAEVSGKNPRVLKSGQMSVENYRVMWETILSGREWRGEFHNRKKNGELYWELASISPLRNASGDVTHFIAVKEDITKRKETEDALRIRNEIMEEDLGYAQKVQVALLPSAPPPVGCVKIDYRFLPLDKVGGDYFSFFPDEKGVGVFIGDVSGHGVPAALFLSLIRFATENIARTSAEMPDQFISQLNQILCQNMTNYFITAAYGYFAPNGDGVAMKYANGAHPGFIVQRAKGGSECVKARGGILGAFPELKYTPGEIHLEKGDRIFYYTDGVPETKNVKGEIIGFDEMTQFIERARMGTLSETCDKILERVTEFRGDSPLEDDVVLIGCEVQ